MDNQGKSLACQFEQMMELGDASDKEAPTTNPRKKYLTNGKQLEVISMLVMMATEDCLQRGAITDNAKRFNMAYSTIHRLWFCFCINSTKYGIQLCQMLGLFKYGMATFNKASENICIIADRCDFHIPKIFSMSGQSLHGQDR